MSKSKRIKLKFERIDGKYVLTVSNLKLVTHTCAVVDGKINHSKLFFESPERFKKEEVQVHTTVCNRVTNVGTGFDAVLN